VRWLNALCTACIVGFVGCGGDGEPVTKDMSEAERAKMQESQKNMQMEMQKRQDAMKEQYKKAVQNN
jgi:hypothetical protein